MYIYLSMVLWLPCLMIDSLYTYSWNILNFLRNLNVLTWPVFLGVFKVPKLAHLSTEIVKFYARNLDTKTLNLSLRSLMVAQHGPHGILLTRPGLSTVTSRSSQLKRLPAKLPTNGGAPPGHRGDQLTAGTSGLFSGDNTTTRYCYF